MCGVRGIAAKGYLLGAAAAACFALAIPGGAGGAALLGRGDFDAYIDIASLPAGAGETMQLFQVAVPVKDLRYAERDGSFRADVRVTIDLAADGTSVFHTTVQMRDSRGEPPRAKDLSAFLCHVDTCVVSPGTYRLTVRVEDLQRRKSTLLGWLRKQYAQSIVKEAVIEARSFPRGEIALGDPILVWSVDRAGGIIPNPMQIYGLRRDTLSVLVSAALPAPADSARFRFSLGGENGEPIEERLVVRATPGGKALFAEAFDLTTFPAGAYRVVVEAEDGTGLYAAAGKDFTVAWELLNWQRPSRDILAEAEFVFNEKQYGEFKEMSLGEQEATLKAFWKKLDPTPQTAVNETYEKYLARVRYADAHFSLFERGSRTDRGFVYVRFGPPDEIVTRPVPKDRAELGEGLEKIGDEYKIIVDGSEGQLSQRMKNTAPTIVSPERQRATRGNVGDDTGSFEIWSYNLKGDPLLPGDEGMTLKQGFRFLFLDADGYGDYRLVGTSEDMFQSSS